ncbi:MAG: phage tail tube protein [Myxococcales bacterium]|nr:phage tail tube protein [Myxococcales bacterium]
MAKKTSIILIKVNGKTIEAKPGITVAFGGKEREPVIAAGRVVGYIEKVVASSVDCTIAHDQNVNIDEIRNWTAVTLVAETDTGVQFQCDDAFVTNNLELKDEAGGIAVKFAGSPMTAN